MTRMELRSREAPMEWEREQDKNLPNIFSHPLPSEPPLSQTTTIHNKQQQQQKPFGFSGSRGSSFASLSSQGSFTNDGWGASLPKPFCQDSQLPGGELGPGTQNRNDSFTFGSRTVGSGDSLTRPQSPNNKPAQGFINTCATSLLGRKGSNSDAATTENMEVDDDHSVNNLNTKAGPFDMGSLRDGVVIDRGTSPRRTLGKSRSSIAHHRTSKFLGPRSLSMQYRNGSGSSFWSEVDVEDESMSDSENENNSFEYRESERFSTRSQSRVMGNRRRFTDHNAMDSHRSDRASSPQQSQGRVWSENVDLPYILAGYVQVVMNSIFVGITLYIIYNFITTIQSDVTIRAEDEFNRQQQIIRKCDEDYIANKCHDPVPILKSYCEEILACKNKPLPRIERSTVAAQTFALIFNSFVNTITYKTMAFLIVIVFGGIYFSNQAISSYRSNLLIHHPHASPISHPGFTSSSSSTPRATDANSMTPSGLKRNNSSYSNHNSEPLGLHRENTLLNRSAITQGGPHVSKTSSSRSLILQHRESRNTIPDSDE